ncbi:PilZ domain-containing protein [Altererythrobacter aerius]|uniref:PilZ domain-containing protein n=1 Tax=Tsuneonella aeria TaxID=1837929 RepID=A0A6I4TCN8_9SPHN|nr:PilZ domain-containing protein [Tsuneonella aeria]MXO75309.1 PilZ domain-containing protein [Tsuneonella aeria]
MRRTQTEGRAGGVSAASRGFAMDLSRIEVPRAGARASDRDVPNARAAPRFTLLMRAAKLIGPDGEFLCVIRDISETGISLRGFHRLPSGPALELELQSGDRHAIEQVWQRGTESGYRFTRPVEVSSLVVAAGRYPRRKLRLSIPFDVDVSFLGGKAEAGVVNLSQQGALVRCTARLAIAQPLRLSSADLPEVRARVRWRRDEHYGVVFDDTFTLDQLALFAARIQCPDLLV